MTNHAWLQWPVSVDIEHVVSQVPNKIDTVYIVSDGCASQFRSKFVFKFLTLIFPEMNIEWHYNEAHHGKGPMDGIGGAVKNTVFRKVLSGEAKIASPVSPSMRGPFVIPTNRRDTRRTRVGWKRNCYSGYVKNPLCYPWTVEPWDYFIKVFFYLSTDKEPHYTQWYGPECGHADHSVDENTCAFCLQGFCQSVDVEWMKCPICNNQLVPWKLFFSVKLLFLGFL